MEPVDPLFGVILPYVNFAVFLAAAIYFFRKPARAAAAQARDRFVKMMGEARQAKESAEARLAELTRRQQGLDREVSELRAQSKASAEQEAARMVADAARLGEHLKVEAQRIAQAEVEKARNELRMQIVAAVQEGVAKRLRTDLDSPAQQQLAKSRIDELRGLRSDH